MNANSKTSFLDKYIFLINKAIEEVEYPSSPKNLYEPYQYIMNLGGKRLRPLLALLSADIVANQPNKAIPVALAIEVFHNFSLVHDDIMDNADLRRNKPTVHTQWNTPVAILTGDVMLVDAFKHLLKIETHRIPEAIEFFSKIAIKVCEGQQLDMDFETLEEVTQEEYINMIRLKSAELIGASLALGAFSVSNDINLRNLFYNVGIASGIAFQIQDDLLDSFGTQASVGKRIGGDILMGKKTILYINAIQELQNENIKREFLSLYSSKPNTLTKENEKISQILDIFSHYKVKLKAEELRDYYYNIAKSKIKELPKSELIQDFNDLIYSLVYREK